MVVVATPSSNGLAARLANAIGDDVVFIEHKTFPDGELYVRVPQRLSGTAVIVHSLHSPQNSSFVRLLLTIDAVKGAGANRAVVVVPYLAYARQDRRFREGEPISVKVVLRAIESSGADALITVDVHKPSSLDEWLSIPHVNVLPNREIAEYFRGKLKDPLVLAPDKGALERAREVANMLSAEYDYLEKTRDRVTGEVSVRPKNLGVEGRDVLIVDDIISTGGTMALAAKNSLESGARAVYAACTHAVLVSGALDRLYAAGVSEVAATDTVPSPVSVVTVAPAIARALSSIL